MVYFVSCHITTALFAWVRNRVVVPKIIHLFSLIKDTDHSSQWTLASVSIRPPGRLAIISHFMSQNVLKLSPSSCHTSGTDSEWWPRPSMSLCYLMIRKSWRCLYYCLLYIPARWSWRNQRGLEFKYTTFYTQERPLGFSYLVWGAVRFKKVMSNNWTSIAESDTLVFGLWSCLS